MQDAYESLAGLPPGTIPPQVLIYLMPLADSVKQQIIKMMSQVDPVKQQAQQLDLQRAGAEVDEKRAGTIHRLAQGAKAASEAHTNVTALVHQAMGIMQGGALDDQAGGQQPGQQAPQPQSAQVRPFVRPALPQRFASVPMRRAA
jgi:hypothetical protein